MLATLSDFNLRRFEDVSNGANTWVCQLWIIQWRGHVITGCVCGEYHMERREEGGKGGGGEQKGAKPPRGGWVGGGGGGGGGMTVG